MVSILSISKGENGLLQVLIPILVLLVIVLFKKIPLIGGNIKAGLLLAGALTLLFAGIINPAIWISSWIDGLNRLSWIIFLSLFGSLFAEVNNQMGAIDTIVGSLAAKFGKYPRILVICILLALTLAGSLLGDSIAAATVIGMLTFGILASMNLEYEKIAALIIMGASVGSIMPPMTQALALSSALTNANPDEVISMGYITITFVLIVTAVYSSVFLVKKDNLPGTNKDIEIKFANQTAGQILRQNWRSLIPVAFLIIVILLRTVKSPISVDLGPVILQNIHFLSVAEGEGISLYHWLSNVTILGGITNGVVISIACAFVFSYIFPVVRQNSRHIIRDGIGKVQNTVMLQICCAFMLGSFYSAGSIEIVSEFCQGLDIHVLKIGGVMAMLLLGMLTGSQSTCQNVIFSFFGPALIASGLTPIHSALVGAHVATAGQCLPGANLCGFVVVGLVASQFGKKVDPMKSMMYCLPMCAALLAVGVFFLF